MDADWIMAIKQWRQLSPAQQRAIRHRNIPRKVARSMAFAGEPVSEQMLGAALKHHIKQSESPKGW